MSASRAFNALDHPKQVDAHHRVSAAYWRDIYQAGELDAVICQQRRERVLALVDKLQIAPGSPFLEVGCGAGITTVDLARRGFTVHALDTVPAMLAMARRAAEEAGVSRRVETSLGDAQALPFTSGAFDLVLCMGVTTCLTSLQPALGEMARVLKSGGHLITNAENRWRLNHLLDPVLFPAFAPLRWKLRDAVAPPSKPRLHMHSVRYFDSALRAAGLAKLHGATLGFGPFTLFNQNVLPERWSVSLNYKLQARADHGFPVVRSTGVQYIVVAQKETR